jgi:restriction endonuclease Mrr
MIDSLHQHHFCNAIIFELEDRSGEADCREVINSLAGPKWFDLSPEEKLLTDPCGTNKFEHSCHAVAQWLRRKGYIAKVKRGIWTRTAKHFTNIDKGY